MWKTRAKRPDPGWGERLLKVTCDISRLLQDWLTPVKHRGGLRHNLSPTHKQSFPLDPGGFTVVRTMSQVLAVTYTKTRGNNNPGVTTKYYWLQDSTVFINPLLLRVSQNSESLLLRRCNVFKELKLFRFPQVGITITWMAEGLHRHYSFDCMPPSFSVDGDSLSNLISSNKTYIKKIIRIVSG